MDCGPRIYMQTRAGGEVYACLSLAPIGRKNNSEFSVAGPHGLDDPSLEGIELGIKALGSGVGVYGSGLGNGKTEMDLGLCRQYRPGFVEETWRHRTKSQPGCGREKGASRLRCRFCVQKNWCMPTSPVRVAIVIGGGVMWGRI